MQYINRRISQVINARVRKDRVIVLTGARQTGKTSLCQQQLPEELGLPYTYISFDDPDERGRFQKAAISILENITVPMVILNEVQKIPALFDPLKFVIDRRKKQVDARCPIFILTGSSQLLLMKNIGETLAGRVALCHLYPFSLTEVAESQRIPLLSSIWQDSVITDRNCSRLQELPPDQARRLRELRDMHLSCGGTRLSVSVRMKWLRDYRLTGAGRMLPLEVKSHDLVSAADGRNLDAFLKAYPNAANMGIVIYPGREIVEIRPRIWAVPDLYLF